MSELVILFAGPMGAGKTTAIRSLSEIDVISTEAVNTDRETADKATTTVALDYGEITLGDDAKVRLYGVPGQKRFNFMWQIIKERAIGLILLVNNDAPQPIETMLEFLDEFGELHERGGIVVGVTRSDVESSTTLTDYTSALAAVGLDSVIPVMSVDTRQTTDARIALMTLVMTIESRSQSRVHRGVAA